jgi:DNA topoisomerase-3
MLLTAVATAGQTLREKELSDAMRENGLGAPATGAAIYYRSTAQAQLYGARRKSVEATDKGIRLIEVVHPDVKSLAMTGQ